MNIHASCVAHGGKGLLILGASGAGKSALALQMIALGAELVADDRTDLSLENGQLIARCPIPLQGLIEARGIGLLRLPFCSQIAVTAVIDLDKTETERMPPLRHREFLGHSLDLIHGSDYLHQAAALICYLAGVRAIGM